MRMPRFLMLLSLAILSGCAEVPSSSARAPAAAATRPATLPAVPDLRIARDKHWLVIKPAVAAAFPEIHINYLEAY
jgi:hypothetical protein